MKNLLLLFVLCLFSLPVFAGNLLQQEYEIKEAVKVTQDLSFHNLSKRGLLENDYQCYLNGGGSLYGVMKYEQERLQKITTPEKNLDLRYINLALKKYDLIIKNQNPHLVHPDKIIIDDKDYKILTDNTKSIIAGFNMLL